MMFKWVGRYQPTPRMLRLCRLMWRRGVCGNGKGYSTKLSVALVPVPFRVASAWDGWAVTVAGVRVHLQRSYGGIHV